MSGQVELTARQQHILKATVRHYIATAEPVGSKALVDDLSVSSATIRSVMGALEKAGLLYQPHTSAGRIPSDFGYRIYVDELIQPCDLFARHSMQLLGRRLNWASGTLEAILREAAQTLSALSGYIALVTLPQTSTSRLCHLQLVQVEVRRVMLVLVTDTYETRSTVMDLALGTDENADVGLDVDSIDRQLQILSNFLNAQLRGKLLTELSNLDWSEIDREFQRYADSVTHRLAELTRQFQQPTSTRMMISGIAEVLRQPEFSESDRVQPLLYLLEEEQEQLFPLIFVPSDPSSSGKRVSVRIGAENPLEPMRSCALVSATYQRDSVSVGSVGILGPTRMAYENAIAMVSATADYLSEALS
ncbi:MAG: heat-inducible transcriptional repressor HrcA [Cyanobacteria bacterium J055]|nr:MAG: heat-inducible transcriptional repressor HrcA [Cyanobacteria bacterium J055]